MAFLCPVRIRNSNSDGTRKKKQDSSKKRSFLSATVNSLINGDRGSGGGVLEGSDGCGKVESDLVLSSSNNNNVQQQQGGGGGAGRITGSSSIETLVRVGLEKEAGIAPEGRNMVVLHDFNPCVDDELEVRRGDVVSILYRENDWVYVILEQQQQQQDGGREGFIPHSYCAPYGSPLAEIALCGGSGGVRKGRRREPASMSDSEGMIMGGMRPRQLAQFQGEGNGGRPHSSFDDHHQYRGDNQSSCSSGGGGSVATVPFFKDPSPTRYIALYKFTARDENDVNVERGELLTVLNKDDPDWFYVVRSDGNEGFVPSAFVYPLSNAAGSARAAVAVPQGIRQQQQQQPTYQQISGGEYSVHNSEENEYADAGSGMPSPQGPTQQLYPPTQPPPPPPNQQQPVRTTPQSTPQSSHQTATTAQQYGTELVMLYDYKAQAPDDLSVRRGDWVYADLLHQTVEGWLWAYAPKQRKYGFIPKAYARPPAMTSL